MNENAGPKFWEAMALSSEKCAARFRDGAERSSVLKPLYERDARTASEQAERRRRTAAAMKGSLGREER